MVLVMLEMFGNCNWERQNSDDAKIEDLILVAAGLVSLNLASLDSLVISASCLTMHVILSSGRRWQVRENEWISTRKTTLISCVSTIIFIHKRKYY